MYLVFHLKNYNASVNITIIKLQYKCFRPLVKRNLSDLKFEVQEVASDLDV